MWQRLVEAVERNDIKRLQALFTQFPEAKRQKGTNQESPLAVAAKAGIEPMVDFFLKAGLDANARDDFGWTPIHEAALQSSEAILKKLLAAKGNPNCATKKGETPLHFACRKGSVQNVAILLRAGAGAIIPTKDSVTPLHEAALSGNIEILRLLLDDGASIKAVTAEGDTPLHFAARNGRIDAAKFLIEKGADQALFNKSMRTPLDTAQDWNQKAFVAAFTGQATPSKPNERKIAPDNLSTTVAYRAYHRLEAAFTPIVTWVFISFFCTFLLSHALNYLFGIFQSDIDGLKENVPFFVQYGKFFMMYSPGNGLLGTDIPLKWWCFNWGMVSFALTRKAITPPEKLTIYALGTTMLFIAAILPMPTPVSREELLYRNAVNGQETSAGKQVMNQLNPIDSTLEKIGDSLTIRSH